MKTFKYTLDRSSKKFHCPACGKRTWVRYVDFDKEYIAQHFGRCDREINCGHINVPKDTIDHRIIPEHKRVEMPASYIPADDVNASMRGYDQSNLFIWMNDAFGPEKVAQALKTYHIGIDQSSPNTKNWVIFWQVDKASRVRSGKIIKYGADGRRCKDAKSTWVHAKSNINGPLYPSFNLKQCLFGEQLLTEYPDKKIAIVESEKTAVIASMFIQDYIWLACGGLSQLREETLAVLRGRSVTLFPDLGSIGRDGEYYVDKDTQVAYFKRNGQWAPSGPPPEYASTRFGKGPPRSAFEIWKAKAKEFDFNISNVLEQRASADDRAAGLDIADFIIKELEHEQSQG